MWEENFRVIGWRKKNILAKISNAQFILTYLSQYKPLLCVLNEYLKIAFQEK